MILAVFTPSDGVNLTLGALEIVLGFVVLFRLGRVGAALRLLAALVLFFFLRGADRIYVSVAGGDPFSITVLLDVLALIVLGLLIVSARRLGHALKLLEDEARYREREYARALADYRRLVRHRLANPLAAMRGALETLEGRPELKPEMRAELLRIAREAARALENAALEPQATGPEERELEPEPQLPSATADRQQPSAPAVQPPDMTSART